MTCDRCNYFSLWTIFCPFTPPPPAPPYNSQKNENFKKKRKKCLQTSSFYTNVPKLMIISYTIPQIWCMMNVIVLFHFGLIFSLLLPNSSKNKFKKMKKKHGDIIIFHMCTKNYD